MRERPIIFSATMVQAILDGRKTQTRRVVKPQPGYAWGQVVFKKKSGYLLYPNCGDVLIQELCPYGIPGDRLWVREAFQRCGCRKCSCEWPRKGPHGICGYRATFSGPSGASWRPSIFMPRWASRITLEITDVRVQRLQEISADDCVAEGSQYPVTTEGCPPGKCVPLLALGDKFAACRYLDKKDKDTHRAYSRAYFASLWDSINAKRGFAWDANPWVWAITFRRVAA